MSTKQLINREIDARKQKLRAVVLTAPSLIVFDTTGVRFPTWVVDVDIGGNRVVRRVPIKVNAAGSRSYAQVGAPVFLEKDAGRYQVIGPADRSIAQGTVVEYDEDARSSSAAGLSGFRFVREPFRYYKGVTPESYYDPGADAAVRLWLRAYERTAGVIPAAPSNIAVVADSDGSQITAVTDKSSHGSSPAQGTAAQRPLYRRFSSTGGNANSRCTADFDGTDDRMPFPGAVTEATPGQISIFLLLNKDNAGAGDDVVLELNHWRLYSRRAGSDTFAFDQGGGVQDSGVALTSSFTLLELIAPSFAAADVYFDGTLRASFSGLGGAGLALGSSTFGGSASLGHHDGRIAELLVIDGAVSAAKRVLIETYFRYEMFLPFSRWSDGVNAFPKVRVFDAAGVEVVL